MVFVHCSQRASCTHSGRLGSHIRSASGRRLRGFLLAQVQVPATTLISRPPKIQKMEPPKYEPITTLGKLGDYWEVPFFGSFRGSGL